MPVPFTDRYEIKVEQTFETHVPVPVLVVDPAYIQIDDVEPGFESNIVVKITNYGLKALENLTLSSDDNGEARSEPLISFLPRLGVLQSVEVPFKITYRGNKNNILPFSYSSCVSGPSTDFAGFLNGVSNFIRGSASSFFSQSQKDSLAAFAVGLAVAGNAFQPGHKGLSGSSLGKNYLMLLVNFQFQEEMVEGVGVDIPHGILQAEALVVL